MYCYEVHQVGEITRDGQINALRQFKRRRDALINEDIKQFDHHFHALLNFLNRDPFVGSVVAPILRNTEPDRFTTWLNSEYEKLDKGASSVWDFPEDPDEEYDFQYRLILGYAGQHEHNFIDLQDRRTRWSDMDGSKSLFLSLVVRPFCLSLGDRMEAAIGMPSQEARELQAVPIERIPATNETRIFLSHKSENKQLVKKYHRILKQLGFDPWLDDPDMPAGTELNRGILAGVNESCAVVFFITEDFVDERILSDEIDYAKSRKMKQGNKFAIITLKFPGDAEVPDLLEKYVYKPIDHDLDGLYEIVRALPIELGPVRWKESALK